MIHITKGQLISKCLFGVFNFSKKTSRPEVSYWLSWIFLFIFGENWGYQKVLLKLSDLYFSQVWFYTILSNFVFHILEWPHVYDKIIKMNYYATILSCKYFHNAASEHMGRFGASCTYFHNHTSYRQNIMKEKWGSMVLILLSQIFVHPIFRFWFLVTFGDEVTKIRKCYIIFVYILQSKMGKMDKTEKMIMQQRWPKYQKPKDGMIET